MTRTPLFGIPFDDVPLAAALDAAMGLMQGGGCAYTVTPNPEIVLEARKNRALFDALTGAALILPDGVGLIWASRLAGTPLRHRLPGIDFAEALLERLEAENGTVYLLGAGPGVAAQAAAALAARRPGLRICGCRHGYFEETENETIIREIKAAHADLILVCLGSPKQELWMQQAAPRLDRGLLIGLGGALDVLAGRKKRAPVWMRRLGLEWLYRLVREPSRIKRMIRLPGILTAAMKEKGRKQE